VVENRIEFKDLIGSMVNLGTGSFNSETDFDNEDLS
jgi:hypothetical protein